MRFYRKPLKVSDLSMLLPSTAINGTDQSAIDPTQTIAIPALSGVHYTDFTKRLGDFISLDISVNSTGWVRSVDNALEWGTFKLETPTGDDLGRRQEFRHIVEKLSQGHSFNHLTVEDVIGGKNFQTNKILYQLNVIPDDMIYEGKLSIETLIREGNKQWKAGLKQASGYKSQVKGSRQDKLDTINALKCLGFEDNYKAKVREDVYDALGLAVGVSFNHYIKPKGQSSKLRTDVSKVFKIEQFSNEVDASLRAHDIGGYVHTLDLTSAPRDLRFNFKRYIETQQNDTGIYVVEIPTTRIGVLALDREFDLDVEISHLVIYLPTKYRKGT